jgi:hypothetical protein
MSPPEWSYNFKTFKKVVLVLPNSSCELSMRLTTFYTNIRHLNPMFNLWLDKLTIHLQGSLSNVVENRLARVFNWLLETIPDGLSYAYDPIGQHFPRHPHPRDHWKPEPSFIEKLVKSWDMHPDGISSNEAVHLNGMMQQISASSERIGRSIHEVMSVNSLLGEYMVASLVRFRPSKKERSRIFPDQKHRISCIKCT